MADFILLTTANGHHRGEKPIWINRTAILSMLRVDGNPEAGTTAATLIHGPGGPWHVTETPDQIIAAPRDCPPVPSHDPLGR